MKEEHISIENQKILFFIIVLFFVILTQFLYVRDYNNSNQVIQGITIEAFGFIADIILFGIAINLYENIWKKKEKINKYLEEIEDYRGWSEKEASYRIFGLMKRLYKLQKYDIDLSDCYFEDIQFSKNMMNGFDFKNCLICNTKFINANLQLSNFDSIKQNQIEDMYDYMTITEITIFENCNLRDSSFKNNSDFVDFEFNNCDFNNADFSNSTFLWCNFVNIDFTNINIDNTIFKKCKFDNKCINVEVLNIEK